MIKVRMKQSVYIYSLGTMVNKNDEVPLEDKLAKEIIEAGYAELVDELPFLEKVEAQNNPVVGEPVVVVKEVVEPVQEKVVKKRSPRKKADVNA